MIRNCCLMLTLNGFLFGNQEMQDNSRESSSHYMEEAFKIIKKGDPNELQRYLDNPEVQKDTEIQILTGLLYNEGRILERNEEKAIAFLEKAAIGSPKAQTYLAYIYLVGDGIEKDVEKGEYWLDKAMQQNDPLAFCMQGTRYYHGDGVIKNFQKAFQLFENSALLGHIPAQYYLAKLFLIGRGVKKDFKKAFHWMKKAADAGCVDAQYELFVMYTNGKGTRRNRTTGLRYLKLAAANGSDTAQYALSDWLARQGRHMESLECCKEALAKDIQKARKHIEASQAAKAKLSQSK